ncbi:MAG: GDP-mannose 4,6-dehydratase, partial [Spirochaetales bacterium]
MRVLVTGVAGFIGFHVAKKLLERGDSVVGIDNLNDYYDPALKIARLRELGVTHTNELFQALEQAAVEKSSGSVHPNVAAKYTETIPTEAIPKNKLLYSETYPAFQFRYLNLADREGVEALFEQESFDGVCHLAAQAGVRYSLTNPMAYVSSNLVGFAHLLEGVRRAGSKRGGQSLQHFVYASSSSVYGLNTRKPFRIQDTVDHPV